MSAKEKRFKEAYEVNYSKIMRLCLGYVNGNKDFAKDITQEVFVKVWENLDGFRGDSHINTWIYRIAINTCLVNLRKLRPSIKNNGTEELPSPEDDIESVDKATMFKSMYACIDRLSEINKAIILLELEGTPQREIADIMGLKHQAIRTRIHRIKNELTKCIQDDKF